MAKAIIEGYGTVDFDPIDYDNNCYDLYCVCICEDEAVIAEEHYTDEGSFRIAINDTYGRELMDERIEVVWWDVTYNGEQYECECTLHFAYVIDTDED